MSNCPAESCIVAVPTDATVQQPPLARNRGCNNDATVAMVSSMTGSQLRAQLRMQQRRNPSEITCNSERAKVAQPDAAVQRRSNPIPCRHWRVYFNDGREPIDVIFSDDQTRAVMRSERPRRVRRD